MAEMLTAAEISEIERDLDELLMPSYETVRRLVADIRRLRHSAKQAALETNRLAAVLIGIDADIQSALKEQG